VADSLSMNWGVVPLIIDFDQEDPERTIDDALHALIGMGVLSKGNTVVIIGAITSGEQIVDAVQMRVVN
jgi:pyruvate kinase